MRLKPEPARRVRALSAALLGVLLTPASAPPAVAASMPLTVETSLTSARAAARYMVAVETAEGRFLYEFDFLEGRFGDDDNIVRQAAAAFALNQYVFLLGDKQVAEPASRALGYAAARSIAFGSGKLVAGDGTTAKGSVGATGLAMLATLYNSRATGDESRRPLLGEWLRGLQAIQLPGGGFPPIPGTADEDSYANGEAWLALAHYQDAYPGDAVAEAVLERADAYLMPRYLERPDRQFLHWGLMAAAQRFETTGDGKFLDFVGAMAGRYFAVLAPKPSPIANNCAAVEGLAAAASALIRAGRQPELVATLRERIDFELTKSLAMQLHDGQTRVPFGPDRFYEDPKLANFAGAFLNSGATLITRIDATQHCLSALLRFSEIPAPSPSPG